jgi:hypothetical protein
MVIKGKKLVSEINEMFKLVKICFSHLVYEKS